MNVHTLLLQQQVIDQENHVFSNQLLLSLPLQENVFGTIFTKSLDLSRITTAWKKRGVPHHLYLINLHRSPSVYILIYLIK